jgi:hypothetical protein
MTAEAEKLSRDIEVEMRRVSEMADRAREINTEARRSLNRAWSALGDANVALHQSNAEPLSTTKDTKGTKI